MPRYEYRCTECDDALEVVQRFSDDPLTVCPSCAGRLRKVFSPVGVVFKGFGFYKTDSRSSGKRDGQRVDAKNGDGPAKTETAGAAASGSDGTKPGDGTSGGSQSGGSQSGGSQSGGAPSGGAKADGATSDGARSDGARSAGKSDGGQPAGSGSGRPKSGAPGSRTSDRAGRSAKESVHRVA